MPLLEVSQLHKRFGPAVVVDDLSFSVAAGEIFGLLGPNGAGKSTTMQMIVGLLEPDAGSVMLDDRSLIRRDPERFREIGYVPQELAIYPELTATENLKFFGDLFGIPRLRLRARIAEVLEAIGLSEKSGQKTGTFSGGMKRRLNFGIGILHQPRILILDEPTVGVDPQSRAHLMNCIRQLADAGVAVIYASHYLEEVEALCDRLSIIDHGRTLLAGRTDELCRSHPQSVKITVTSGSDSLSSRLPKEAKYQKSMETDVATIEMPVGKAHATASPTLTGQNNRRIPDDESSASHLLEIVTELLTIVRESGAELREIQTPQPNLEQLFLSLTGRSLRD